MHYMNGNRNGYFECITELKHALLKDNGDNVQAIVLYGGLVRDKLPLQGWSDIDVIVVFKDILARDADTLAKTVFCIASRYEVRIDLTQATLKDIECGFRLRSCFHSEFLNAASLTEGVSEVIYGSIPKIPSDKGRDKAAALYYINTTLFQFRRFMIEEAHLASCTQEFEVKLSRIIRWVFSVVRASLRLFDIYCHPYEASIAQLEQILPQLDISLLRRLSEIRRNVAESRIDRNILTEVEVFLETYIDVVLKEYFNEPQQVV